MPTLNTGSPSLSPTDAQYLSDFAAVPWAHTLLNSPTHILVPFTTRDPNYDPADKRTFACFRSTLATAETIRAFICLQRAPSPNPPSTSTAAEPTEPQPAKTQELLSLISLGSPGLDGWPGVLHGGIVALLLDEILGAICEQVLSVEVMTASMKVDYKRAVPTPSVLLGRASIERSEGRKAWISATLEDGEGGVYAVAEALFVRPKGRMLERGEGGGAKL